MRKVAEKSNESVVLFGGSFDPVHLGHKQMIDYLAKRYDKVILLPCYVSPFKLSKQYSSVQDRLNMLKLVTHDYSNVEVSGYEAMSKKVSYTIDTLHHFSDLNEINFVVGSDSLASISSWYKFDEINELVTFVIFERSGFPLVTDKLRDFVVAEKVADYSSSVVRVANAFGAVGDYVTESVAEYIAERGLFTEYNSIVERFGEFKMKPSRKEHTFRAVCAGIKLAKLNDFPEEKAIRALLLHDIAKSCDKQFCIDNDLIYDDNFVKSCVHAPIGAQVAKKFFCERDESVLQAIKYHTTGGANMSTLDKIVFCADYIEDGRIFEGLDEIRSVVYADLNAGTLLIIENTLKYLSENNQQIAPNTLVAYEEMKKVVGKTGGI